MGRDLKGYSEIRLPSKDWNLILLITSLFTKKYIIQFQFLLGNLILEYPFKSQPSIHGCRQTLREAHPR